MEKTDITADAVIAPVIPEVITGNETPDTTTSAQQDTQGEALDDTQKVPQTIEELKIQMTTDFEARLQSETDKRVNQAVNKVRKEYEEARSKAPTTDEKGDKIDPLAKEKKELELARTQLKIEKELMKKDLGENLGLFFSPDKYLGEGAKELEKDIAAFDAIVEAEVAKRTQSLTDKVMKSMEQPGTGLEYDLYTQAQKKGNVLEMLSLKRKLREANEKQNQSK